MAELWLGNQQSGGSRQNYPIDLASDCMEVTRFLHFMVIIIIIINYLLNAYYVPDILLNAIYSLFHLFLLIIQGVHIIIPI